MDEKIIKAKPTAEPAAIPGQKVVKKEIFSATLEARDIVQMARQQAAEVLEEAGRQREAILAKAREDGYEEGLRQWNAALASAHEAAAKLEKDYEAELVRLAVRIAEKIIGGQLASAPETIVGIVREALRSVRRERSLSIQVNSAHLEEVRRHIGKLEEVVGSSRDIHIVANDSVAPGGCIVESDLGVIDARLETQLKCMEEILLRAAKK